MSSRLGERGQCVAYRVLGMGPAVLLVNGTGGGDGHWGDLIERLARSRTVVSLDYSGAGETTDDGAPLDLPTLARQVAAIRDYSAVNWRVRRPV